MIEAKFFTVGTYLYKYNLTVLFVSPSKIAHEKFYIYCPPLLLNEIYAHGLLIISVSFYMTAHVTHYSRKLLRHKVNQSNAPQEAVVYSDFTTAERSV